MNLQHLIWVWDCLIYNSSFEYIYEKLIYTFLRINGEGKYELRSLGSMIKKNYKYFLRVSDEGSYVYWDLYDKW